METHPRPVPGVGDGAELVAPALPSLVARSRSLDQPPARCRMLDSRCWTCHDEAAQQRNRIPRPPVACRWSLDHPLAPGLRPCGCAAPPLTPTGRRPQRALDRLTPTVGCASAHRHRRLNRQSRLMVRQAAPYALTDMSHPPMEARIPCAPLVIYREVRLGAPPWSNKRMIRRGAGHPVERREENTDATPKRVPRTRSSVQAWTADSSHKVPGTHTPAPTPETD